MHVQALDLQSGDQLLLVLYILVFLENIGNLVCCGSPPT